MSLLVPFLEHAQRQVVTGIRERAREKGERKLGELKKLQAVRRDGAKKIAESTAEGTKALEKMRAEIEGAKQKIRFEPTDFDAPSPRLFEESIENFSDAKPSWSAFTCLDGFAWLRRKRCGRTGLLPYSVVLVAPAIDTRLPAIERVLALRRLAMSREVNALRIMYPHHCICGESHHYEGLELLRMAMAIHEAAIPILVRARPSLRKLKFVDMPPQRRRERTGPPERTGIPVRDPRWHYKSGPPEDEATRIAQISWACALMAEDA